MTQDMPGLHARVDSLNFYLRRRLEISLMMVTLRRSEGLAAAVVYTSTQQGRTCMEKIRGLVNLIQTAESVHLAERRNNDERSLVLYNRFSMVTFILMFICSILLLILIGKYLLQNKEKEKRAAELVIANIELAYQIEEKAKRAEELDLANEVLVFENEEKEKREDELIIINEEHRKTEEALRKSNELFFKLFDHNPAAMGIRELNDDRFINVNNSFLKLFGFVNKEEVIGKSSMELNILPFDDNKRRAQLKVQEEGKFIKEFEITLRNRKGEALNVSRSFMELEIDGKLYLLTVSVDITERKKAQDDLKAAIKGWLLKINKKGNTIAS